MTQQGGIRQQHAGSEVTRGWRLALLQEYKFRKCKRNTTRAVRPIIAVEKTLYDLIGCRKILVFRLHRAHTQRIDLMPC